LKATINRMLPTKKYQKSFRRIYNHFSSLNFCFTS
jgi:hypothetical protein